MTPRALLDADDTARDRAERLLEVAHVAHRLSLCTETVLRRIRSGVLPAVKLEGGLRVRQADLDAFVAARQYQPARTH